MTGDRDEHDLQAAVDRYEQSLTASHIHPQKVRTLVEDARLFVAWLSGDGQVPARSSAPGEPPPHPAPSGPPPSSGGIPHALGELVARWRSAQMPAQAAMRWPRHHWIDTFPQHASILEALPAQLDRAFVGTMCTTTIVDSRSAEQAFLAVMAWGFGDVGYGPWRTQRILTETPNAGERLFTVARTIAESGAITAYQRFASDSDCRLRYLGPAFGTKYLYFCQPTGQRPQALIHDDLMSRWLLREAGLELSSVSWSEVTYRRYLERMHLWSAALDLEPDQVEYCIFQAMATERASQWAG